MKRIRRGAALAALAAGCAEAFMPLPAVVALRRQHAPGQLAPRSPRSLRVPALRMSSSGRDDSEEFDVVFARVDIRTEVEPVQLVMAYFEHAYQSESAERPMDHLEASLAAPYIPSMLPPTFPPPGTTTLSESSGTTTLSQSNSGTTTFARSLIDTAAPSSVPPTTPAEFVAAQLEEPEADKEVIDVLARVKAMEDQHEGNDIITPTKDSKWSREHSLSTCCQWEKRQVSEAIINNHNEEWPPKPPNSPKP
jgi:hypothetical protein